jgi:UDP-glucose:(heptosyl)LPS alpha-1,3-glucosyltransferase
LEKYTEKLIKAFTEKGCQVTLLTTGNPPLSLGNTEVVSLAPDTKFSLYHLHRFNACCKSWLKAHPQDIVFGMERTTQQTHYRAGSGLHAVYLKQRALTDSYLQRFSLSLNPLHHQILASEKAAFEDPNLKILFTNSNMVKEEILTHYSVEPDKIEVVHNGVEWADWQIPFEESLNQEKKETFHFLFIGNGYKRKGLLFLLQGLCLLKKEDFKLTVIGKDKNIPFFIRQVVKYDLQDKVEFLGPQPSILPFYQAADALVIPSIYDPFANVTLEARAMGLFVVSSRFNGGQEVLQKEASECIEDLASPQSVANSLQRALEHAKNEFTARKIRQSIKGLDFSYQLDKIVTKTLLS